MKFQNIVFLFCLSIQSSILPMKRTASTITQAALKSSRRYTALSIAAATGAGTILYNSPKTARAMSEAEALKIVLPQLFKHETNPNCKHASASCNYSIDEALQVFYEGSFPNSVIPDLSFQNNADLMQWAKNQKSSETYIIAYKPQCFPCASLLVIIESTMQKSSKKNNNIFKINTKNNRNAFVDLEGTPTIFKIKNGIITEFDRDEFIQVVSKLV